MLDLWKALAAKSVHSVELSVGFDSGFNANSDKWTTHSAKTAVCEANVVCGYLE